MNQRVRIGWAGRDITPDRPVLVRGLFNLRVSTRVNDPLTLTALAVESGEEQAILVSVDAAGIDEEVLAECRGILGSALPELDGGKLVVSATHTHTAPFAGGNVGLQKEADYIDDLRARFPDYMTVVQLAGGGTYLPTERAASGCSYGAVPASCRVAPAGGQMIVDEAVSVIGTMFASREGYR